MMEIYPFLSWKTYGNSLLSGIIGGFAILERIRKPENPESNHANFLESIKQSPYEGLGKPEALKHDWSGYWSRRINKEHRLIYKTENERIIVAQLRGHY
jgi:Txe/YoeB family toxin of toxin-antitoxin system